MTHFQGSVTGQNEAISRLPKTFSLKAVMRPDLLKEARSLVPGLYTVLRHWNDSYQWSTDWQTNLTMARQWFGYFVDDTFKHQYAGHVMAVSERNEYDSHVLPPEVRATRIMWMQAASWVWNQEYKNQLQQFRPGLPPIQLVLCDTAPGNDLPREAAVLAIDSDDVLGYHPYIAVYKPSNAMRGFTPSNRETFHLPSAGAPESVITIFDGRLYQIDMGGNALSNEPELVPIGERSAGDWQWCSGRWHFMEQAWGLKPRWAFTEAGPIRDQTGTLGLDPLGGWRELGDRAKYAATVTSWMKDVQTTPAYQEGRIVGYHLFTVPGGGQWAHFAHDLGDLNSQVDVIIREWKPGTVVIPPPSNPLPITPLSQRDPRWDTHIMGPDSTGRIRNIGDFGCLVTDWCMMLRQWGISQLNPAELWEHIKATGGTNGAYLKSGSLAAAFPGKVKYNGYTGGGPDLYAQIRANKDKGWITPVRVDFNPTTPTQEEHWVNIVDYLPDDNFAAADPWTGQIITINLVYGIPGPDILTAQWYEPIATASPPRRYNRTCHLLPQDATPAEYDRVTSEAYALRQSVLQSIDDALITHPNLTGRKVYVWGDVSRHGAFTDKASFEAWVVANYPPLPEIVYRSF